MKTSDHKYIFRAILSIKHLVRTKFFYKCQKQPTVLILCSVRTETRKQTLLRSSYELEQKVASVSRYCSVHPCPNVFFLFKQLFSYGLLNSMLSSWEYCKCPFRKFQITEACFFYEICRHKITSYGDLTPYILVERQRRFWGTCFLHLYGIRHSFK